jgi:hypothetical protein
MNRRDFFGRLAAGAAASTIKVGEPVVAREAAKMTAGSIGVHLGSAMDSFMRDFPRRLAANENGIRQKLADVLRNTPRP